MPFCPACRAEYLPSVKTCPDCSVEVVPELPVDTIEMVDWVCVYRASTEVAATMVQGILSGEDIRSVIRRNVVPGYVIPGSWSESQWGEVLVSADTSEQAESIVQEYLDGLPYDQDDDTTDQTENAAGESSSD